MNKEDAKILKLDNGLTIIIYSDKTKVMNYCELITKFGGLSTKFSDNTKIIPGTAHLLEHYVYENNINGIIRNILFDNKAISSNASTGENITNFYFNTVNNFENLLKIFLDSIYNVIFTEERLEKTKIPVYNEIRDKDETTFIRIKKQMDLALFNEHIPILGFKDNIDSIDINYLKDVYDNSYVPDNQILVLGGNFDSNKIINIVKECYKNYKFNNTKKLVNTKYDNTIYKNNITIKEDAMDEVVILYKICLDKYTKEEIYKLDFYCQFFLGINFSKHSILSEKLERENIIIENITSSLQKRKNTFVLEISAYAKDREKFISAITSELNNFNNTSNELELMKREVKTRVAIRKDDIASYIFPILDNLLILDYPYIDNVSYIDKLSIDEYNKYIKEIDFNNKCIIYIENNQK